MDDAHLGEVIGEAVVIVDDDHRPPVVLHQRRAGDQRQTASLALGFKCEPLQTLDIRKVFGRGDRQKDRQSSEVGSSGERSRER